MIVYEESDRDTYGRHYKLTRFSVGGSHSNSNSNGNSNSNSNSISISNRSSNSSGVAANCMFLAEGLVGCSRQPACLSPQRGQGAPFFIPIRQNELLLQRPCEC